jgi:hypothetical protein
MCRGAGIINKQAPVLSTVSNFYSPKKRKRQGNALANPFINVVDLLALDLINKLLYIQTGMEYDAGRTPSATAVLLLMAFNRQLPYKILAQLLAS